MFILYFFHFSVSCGGPLVAICTKAWAIGVQKVGLIAVKSNGLAARNLGGIYSLYILKPCGCHLKLATMLLSFVLLDIDIYCRLAMGGSVACQALTGRGQSGKR